MEIRLGTIEKTHSGETYNFLALISEEENHNLLASIKEIEEINNTTLLWEMITMNHNDLFRFFEDSKGKLIPQPVIKASLDKTQRLYFYKEANRLLLNYLSSFKTFLDHSETTLRKRFGKNSKELSKFESDLSYYYENKFCYRFLYKLRNFAQHCGLPLKHLRYEIFQDKATQELKGRLVLNFNKTYLLSNYDGWGSKLKIELKNGHEEFDVIPCLIEMTAIMQNVAESINSINEEKLIKSAKYIKKLTDNLRTNREEICIFRAIKAGPETNGRDGYHIKHIPFETVDLVE